MVEKFEVLDSELVFDEFLKILKEKVRLPDDKTMDYYTLQLREVVSILAINDKEEVLMCEQYRHPTKQILEDFPAGFVEEGEDLETAAKRELAEETGYTAKKLKKLGSYYYMPGISNVKITYFLATGLKKEKDQNLDPSEFIDVKLVPLEDLKKKIMENDHIDMPSGFGVFLYLSKGGKNEQRKRTKKTRLDYEKRIIRT